MTTEQAATLTVGERVEYRDEDSRCYGTVTKRSPQTFTVAWDDGKTSKILLRFLELSEDFDCIRRVLKVGV
jgi:hypothetical protein